MTPNRIARGMLFLIGMLMTGCASKRDETGPISYPRETARLVSHVTSDFIRAGDDIRVRFVSPVASGNRVGQTLDRDVFTFVPRIVKVPPVGRTRAPCSFNPTRRSRSGSNTGASWISPPCSPSAGNCNPWSLPLGSPAGSLSRLKPTLS